MHGKPLGGRFSFAHPLLVSLLWHDDLVGGDCSHRPLGSAPGRGYNVPIVSQAHMVLSIKGIAYVPHISLAGLLASFLSECSMFDYWVIFWRSVIDEYLNLQKWMNKCTWRSAKVLATDEKQKWQGRLVHYIMVRRGRSHFRPTSVTTGIFNTIVWPRPIVEAITWDLNCISCPSEHPDLFARQFAIVVILFLKASL